ncbi:hypothetical protein Hanom_Chr17g01585151 [Helianthus anomalus]
MVCILLTNWGSPVGHRHPSLLRGTGFKSWEWHMSPRVRTRHGEVTAELAWSGSGSRSEITPAVGRTVHLPPWFAFCCHFSPKLKNYHFLLFQHPPFLSLSAGVVLSI